MDAGKDSGVRALARRLGETRERSGDPLEGFAAGDHEAGLVAAQGAGESCRCRRAERALRRRVVRHGRGVLMTIPGRITDGGVVAVVVTLADGGDRAPQIVYVADLPACDDEVVRARDQKRTPRKNPGMTFVRRSTSRPPAETRSPREVTLRMKSIVSGVTMVATCRKTRRPSRRPFAASRWRWSSVSRRRRPLSWPRPGSPPSGTRSRVVDGG
jgi:hypothetical protein